MRTRVSVRTRTLTLTHQTHRKSTRHAPYNANQSGVIRTNEQKHFQLTDGMTCTYDDTFAIMLISLFVHRDKRKTMNERKKKKKKRNVRDDMPFFILNLLPSSTAEYIGSNLMLLYVAVKWVDVDSTPPPHRPLPRRLPFTLALISTTKCDDDNR